MSPSFGLCCRLVPEEELMPCLQWAMPRCRIDQAAWMFSQVTERVEAGRASEIIAGTVSWSSGAGTKTELLAAVMAVQQDPTAATLLLLQTVSAAELQVKNGDHPEISDPRDLIQPLLEPVLERLRRLGITFLQATCDEPQQGDLLRAASFEPLAELALMVLPAADFARAAWLAAAELAHSPVSPSTLQWTALESIGNDWENLFTCVAANTFNDTADCPRLGEFRDAEEIVASYRTAPTFDRKLSKLLRVKEQWAGCLVLARSEASAFNSAGYEPSNALELTYMGLRPECRGQRLSAALLAETVREATHLGASQIMLGVDRQNLPARACYQRFGWREVAQERVWGRRV